MDREGVRARESRKREGKIYMDRKSWKEGKTNKKEREGEKDRKRRERMKKRKRERGRER